MRLLKLLIALLLLIAPFVARAQIDHTPKWSNNFTALTYNLIDLDGFAVGSYGYCKWGNLQDRTDFFDREFYFTRLTEGPFSNDNLDLFIAYDTDEYIDGYSFPAQTQWYANALYFSGISSYRLYRYFHFENELVDAETGSPLVGDEAKLIILFHGWNPDSNSDAYSGAEFASLLSNLRAVTRGTDWHIVKYRWEPDSDTGGKDIKAIVNGTEAAEIGHQHGQHLGQVLSQEYPNLQKVHLIAHSAGSWAARGALRHLQQNRPNIAVQMTLLDPFMPNAAGANSSLGKSVMDVVDTYPRPTFLAALENYYSDDLFILGTQEVFSWGSTDRNQRIDWVGVSYVYYQDHSGPVVFYSDTIARFHNPSLVIPSLDNFDLRPDPYSVSQIGWNNSLFLNEPIFTSQPQSQSLSSNSTLTLTAQATTRKNTIRSGVAATSLTWLWFKDNQYLISTTGPSLVIPNAQPSNSGKYHAAIYDAAYPANRTTTEYADVTITAAPAAATPTISPGGGSYAHSSQVTLACTTPGATIRYTTNGSDPTNSSVLYSAPFTLTNSATVKAKAFASGYSDSAVASATFTITTSESAPIITSATSASGTIGSNFSYSITASNSPTSFGANELPAGIMINTATGLISGTPTVGGTFGVTISATNTSGTGTATLTLTIANGTIAAVAPGISCGFAHSVFLKSDGTVWATGYNLYGQLGDGTVINRSMPVQVMTGVSAVSAGAFHTLFLKVDGSVWATGLNYEPNSPRMFGQLGDGSSTNRSTPVQVMNGVKAVAAGASHSLFLKTDGSAWATGYNEYGQLGDGTTTSRSTPVQVMSGVAAIFAGGNASFFLRFDGSVWATGYNYYGGLGDGTTSSRSYPVQVMTGVSAVASAWSHTLFLKSDGSVWATGANSAGQLGDGTTTNRSTPMQVMAGVAAIAAGGDNSLFLKSDGSVRAAGSFNLAGSGSAPAQILTDVTTISAGAYHAVFRKLDGSVWAIGANDYGQLGDGSSTSPVGFVSVLSLPGIPQTITFDVLPATTYGTTPILLIATASSGLTPTYSILSGPATVSGSTMTLTGVGTVSVRASQAGNGIYAAATPVDRSFNVAKAAQTITFGDLSTKIYGEAPFVLSATSSSGLAPAFSVLSGPATITGNVLTVTGLGTVLVRAFQTGDANYNAAANVDRSFSVISPADAFANYLTTASVPLNLRGAADDPDVDGLPNLLEYALGRAPMAPDLTGLPQITLSAAQIKFTYRRVQSGISYSVQTTTDLSNPASWSSVGVNQGTPDANGNVVATMPINGSRRFLRLHVTLNP